MPSCSDTFKTFNTSARCNVHATLFNLHQVLISVSVLCYENFGHDGTLDSLPCLAAVYSFLEYELLPGRQDCQRTLSQLWVKLKKSIRSNITEERLSLSGVAEFSKNRKKKKKILVESLLPLEICLYREKPMKGREQKKRKKLL